MHNWQFTNIAWLYAAAVLISILLAYKALKMRPVRGAFVFSLLSMFNGIWSLSYLLGFFNTNLEWKLILLRFEYLGILGSGLLWFIFILTYIDYKKLLKPNVLFIIALPPVLAFIEVLFFQSNQLLYKSYGLIHKGEYVRLYKEYGIGFYIITGYNYMFAIVGTIMLLNAVRKMPEQLRAQILYIVLSIIIILAVNFFYIQGLSPVKDYDFTSVSFVVIGMVFYMLISRYRFLDIVPVAHNQILKELNSGIIIIDAREYILEMNPASEKIFACSQNTCIGKKVYEIFDGYKKITSRSENKDETKAELKIGKNSQTYTVDITSLKDNYGRPAGKIIMLNDVTELKNALDDLDTYAHTVAHDLKNPLSSLLGYCELIESQSLSEQDISESIKSIKNTTLKMENIIESLLLMSSVRRQKNLSVTELDIKQVILNSLERLRTLIAGKNADIKFPESFPGVKANEQWVEEVFVNYLSNAVKYGGTPPKIEIGFNIENDFIKFTVKDNGEGLTAEEQENLFKEFNMMAYKNIDAGHGLGLSIVKRIVGKLSGQVGVESEPGKGSTFYFTLPSR